MNNLLSSVTEKLSCTQDDCLSWIIILLNILTVFYLVFCSWYKVTKTVKVIGYVWASLLTVGTVAVIAFHTCLFSILSGVFTGLIVMAVLSVVFDKGVLANSATTEDKRVKASGCYVVHKTDKGNYVFVIYDGKKNAVVKSCYKYANIEQVKSAIDVCRKNGYIAAVEDKTRTWIEFVNHPKFILSEYYGKYSFIMALSTETIIVKSDTFDSYDPCKKAMDTAISAVLSEKVYYAEREILADDLFVWANEPVTAQAETEEVATTVAPAAPAEEVSLEAVEGGVRFNTEKKTLDELYAELSKVQRKYFDEIRARAESKENVKSSQSKDNFTVYYGRDKVVRLRIRKNTVEAIFFLVDNRFKKVVAEGDAKVKETPTVIKIVNDDYFNVALETVDFKYDSIIADRKAKRASRKA